MTSGPAKRFRYGSVSRQMERVSNDHDRRLRQAWINRVLDFLDNDNLIGKAASLPKTEDPLLFDCNFAPMVWDEPRIAFRLKQLAANEVTVDLVDHEHTIAGKTFKRTQIRVAF